MMCGENPDQCNVCSNTVYSNVLDTFVHDPYNGKVFCPFGKGESMNQSTIIDQAFINSFNISVNNNYNSTIWGKAPQLSQRPLTKIGLSWRTS